MIRRTMQLSKAIREAIHGVKDSYLNAKDTAVTAIAKTYRNNEVACDVVIFVGLITLVVIIGEIIERSTGVSI